MCDNKCGCHKRRRCNICGLFNGFDRKRCGHFDDDFGFERFERCERFERFDSCGKFHDCDRDFRDCDRFGHHGRKCDELTRADFYGFFPEAKFEKGKKECCCKR